MRREPRIRPLALALALAAPACSGSPSGEPAGCPAPLAETIDLVTLELHLLALADLGQVHADTRAAGTDGFAASVEYVAEKLLAAGLTVRREPFTFDDFVLLAPPRLHWPDAPGPEYEAGVDFRVAAFSASGDVAGPVLPVDLSLGPDNKSTSGCQPEDFAGFFPGSIALLQRGGCTHQQKVDHAVAAGAAAVVYFNQGDIPERLPLFTARLDPGTTLPVVAVPYALGEALAQPSDLRLRLVIAAEAVVRESFNVIADTAPTASGRVVMLGAHLDSVPAGPGVNDNGSGVAALLGIAGALPRCDLRHQVRFAFWGAEELGLLGSIHHVESMSAEARAAIALYLNLDMIASPNPVRFVYDGDGSAWQKAGPPGSAAIEAALTDYFVDLGVPTRETAFDGRSDYWAFIRHDIAAGGLFTGAEARKSSHEAQLFGGEAEVAYDPCYHARCDDRDNYSRDALLENTRATAHVLAAFAMSDPPLPEAAPEVAPRAATEVHPPEHCDDRR
ncbi:M20/M25/M40 family metallo-hydrolase [Nannocystis bainbridge]|uniref:M20/M25/M40 family metallo-hydrolase n=1 Tax=Nannocystis bainbridge TaxID=2995303 RepID=A0ABT5DYW0_9BACT|nr:M20/M25/M40 family metallo-hydrolase [Nannocystis bainbridge]MDC0718785.1 M20/M25/M40 family metallo-hydrolase [Nannocystis bainbridge]